MVTRAVCVSRMPSLPSGRGWCVGGGVWVRCVGFGGGNNCWDVDVCVYAPWLAVFVFLVVLRMRDRERAKDR